MAFFLVLLKLKLKTWCYKYNTETTDKSKFFINRSFYSLNKSENSLARKNDLPVCRNSVVQNPDS